MMRSLEDSSARSRPHFVYKFEFRDDDVFTKHVIHIRIKENGVAVDPQSCHVQDSSVYRDRDSDVIYSAYLAETDVEYRKNSYYKIQILIPEKTKIYCTSECCWLLQTHGGIGAAGYMYNETAMSIADAKREFEEIFERLTGNAWQDRERFEKIRGKMNMLQIVYTSNDVSREVESSQLEKAVQDVVKLMVSSRAQSSPPIQTRDSRKWPLGILSEKHIEEAFEILGQLLDCIGSTGDDDDDDVDDKTMIRLTNKYYSTVPHSDCPRLLNTAASIQDEFEFLDTLPTIIRFTSTLDAHYANLSTKLYPLQPTDPLYAPISTCVRWGNVRVDEIFRLNRHGEDHRYLPFKDFDNKKLLWHGSPIANFIPILSQGLIIHGKANHGTFGSGIYFSDMVAKSIPYCRMSGTTGLLLLCEVALGRMEARKSSCSARAFSEGFDSVFGCGQTVPNPGEDMILDDGVVLAVGQGRPSTENSSMRLPYNEYVVYNEAQVKMKYLVKFSLIGGRR